MYFFFLLYGVLLLLLLGRGCFRGLRRSLEEEEEERRRALLLLLPTRLDWIKDDVLLTIIRLAEDGFVRAIHPETNRRDRD